MQAQSLVSQHKWILAAALAALPILSVPMHAQDDPPAETGRLSSLSGAVSIQPAGTDDWAEAYPNLPLGPGDRVFTDVNSRTEIQVGQIFIRVGPDSDVSLVEDDQGVISVGVAQGSVHVRCYGLWPGQSFYVNTPSGSAGIEAPGEFRVDVYPGQQAAIFTSDAGDVYAYGAGSYSQYVDNGAALELVGVDPVYPEWLAPAPFDALDQWSEVRDRQIAMAASYRFVSPEIPGAYELDAAGQWTPDSPYGAIWFPYATPAGWAPYHYGHWVDHWPWGWVWVEDEPWGYAPFHYGRWVSFEGRWGWVPGPPSVHPVWSPALVVFAGGVAVGGGSVSAWFPLGPGEPYQPWYPCSREYVDQVNITNITVTNVVHLQTNYVNVNINNVTYVNRSIGVTAVSNADFAAGRPVSQVAVHVTPEQVAHIQVVQRPAPQPNPQAFAAQHPPARPVPVAAARPAVINQAGQMVTAKPGTQPVAPPVRQVAQAPRPLPGRTTVAPPSHAQKVVPPPKTAPATVSVMPSRPEPASQVRTAQPPAQPAQQPYADRGLRQQSQPQAPPRQAQPQPVEREQTEPQPTRTQPVERPAQPAQPQPEQQPPPRPEQQMERPQPTRNEQPQPQRPDEPPTSNMRPEQQPSRPPQTPPAAQPKPPESQKNDNNKQKPAPPKKDDNKKDDNSPK
jgi:hypothetical protein